MRRKVGWLVDHDVGEVARGEDGARTLAASARIEIVAMEVEGHDPRMAHLLEKRVELRRVVAPAVKELAEAPVSGGRGDDHGIDLVAAIGGHEREEGAEGLAGERHLAIALM